MNPNFLRGLLGGLLAIALLPPVLRLTGLSRAA